MFSGARHKEHRSNVDHMFSDYNRIVAGGKDPIWALNKLESVSDGETKEREPALVQLPGAFAVMLAPSE